MLKEIHEHMMAEMQQNSRTDTIFMVTAVVYNLIVLGINSAVAGEASSRYAESDSGIIFWVFMIVTLIVNGIVLSGLNYGRSTRSRLLKGLMAMYADNGVDQYYDGEMISSYSTRYKLFMGVILCLGLTAIVVPLIVLLV